MGLGITTMSAVVAGLTWLLLAPMAPGPGLVVAPQSAPPIVSVWYRGGPAGVPRLDDLAALRALGFLAVTWPEGQRRGEPDLRRLASSVGLLVEVRAPGAPLTAERALRPPNSPVDIAVGDLATADVPALMWRAFAHGAREIAFDPGADAPAPGWLTPQGEPAPWLAHARELARQFEFNAALIQSLRPGPPVALPADAPAGLDVVLLDGGRSWLLVATNASRARLRAEVPLPAGVPAALWTNLLDGANMSMLATPAGPRWTLALDRGAAAVYAIDKPQMAAVSAPFRVPSSR